MASRLKLEFGVMKPTLVKDAASSYIAYVEDDYEQTYARGQKQSVRRVLEGFGASGMAEKLIDKITAKDILDFLQGLMSRKGGGVLVPASAKTKNNYYTIIRCMFDHARFLGALSRRVQTEAELLTAPGYNVPIPEVYKFSESAQIVNSMPDGKSLMYVGLQEFAGLRPCEAILAEKRDFRRSEDRIRVRDEAAKDTPTKSPRAYVGRWAPITAPLLALLNSVDLPEGRLFDDALDARVRKSAKSNGVKWLHDGLRHTFITYRLQVVEDRGQVAREAGHLVGTQIAHYEGLVDPDDVAPFWAQRPSAAGLVWDLVAAKS